MGSATIDGVYHPNANKPEMYRAAENKVIVEMIELADSGPIIQPGAERKRPPIGVVIHVGPGVFHNGQQKVAPFQAGDYVVLNPQFMVGAMPDQYKRDRVLCLWESVMMIIPESMRQHLRAEMFQRLSIEVPSGLNGRA